MIDDFSKTDVLQGDDVVDVREIFDCYSKYMEEHRRQGGQAIESLSFERFCARWGTFSEDDRELILRRITSDYSQLIEQQRKFVEQAIAHE